MAVFESATAIKRKEKILLTAVYIPPANSHAQIKGYSDILTDLVSDKLRLQLQHNIK